MFIWNWSKASEIVKFIQFMREIYKYLSVWVIENSIYYHRTEQKC